MIYKKNIKYTCHKKFIQVYVCQKLSKKVCIWKSYGKNKTVQFFLPHSIYITKPGTAVHKTSSHHHVPYGITQCYLPPGSGDFPAFIPTKAGTRFSDPRGCKAVKSSKIIKVGIAAHGNQLTATGNHMLYGITQCYLPPGSGDFPAFTPAEVGTQFSNTGGMQGWVEMGGGEMPTSSKHYRHISR